MSRTEEHLVHDTRGAVEQKLVRDSALAKALDVGRSQVHVMRKRGMPSVAIGGARRYDIDECIAWLRANTEASVSKSRADQGLPVVVEDPTTLARIADLVNGAASG